MTNDEKREQARILLSCKSSEHATHKDADIDAALKAGAAALLREAEAATAPDVSEAERPKRLCDYDPVETTVGDMVMRFGFDYTNFKFFAESITKLTAALRAARQREGELTQALADAKAENEKLRAELAEGEKPAS